MRYLKLLNNFLWSFPMIFFLMGTHIYFTFRLKFPQRKTLSAIKTSVQTDPEQGHGISGFAALSTTLAATLGTGNIVGVSTAVALGGPGAIFWCWLTGILGMATSYAECYLSFLYRKQRPDHTYAGGPMYVIRDGLKKKNLAILYAVFLICASFGVGCTTQANAITETTTLMWNLNPTLVGIIVSVVCGFVILGGISFIGKVCERLVPIMGFFYIICCVILLIINYKYIGTAIYVILSSAFEKKAATGGFIGSTILISARYGIARGLFTNEAGLGSAAIAACESNTKNPKRQALIQMTATFWDTVVMCAITGLVIVTAILANPDCINGCTSGSYTSAAFRLIPYGDILLSCSLIAFAFATLIGWSFFGERAVEFLFGTKLKQCYQTAYLFMIFVGAIMSLDLVWELTDLINACMIIPNVTALLLLRDKIKL